MSRGGISDDAQGRRVHRYNVSAGHLEEDAVIALAGDEWLGSAHAVEALFDHFDGLVHLGWGDRGDIPLTVRPRLDVHGK